MQCSGSKYLTAKLEGSFCSFEPGSNLNYFKLKPTYKIKNLKIISIQKRYQVPVIKSKLLGHLNLFDNYSISRKYTIYLLFNGSVYNVHIGINKGTIMKIFWVKYYWVAGTASLSRLWPGRPADPPTPPHHHHPPPPLPLQHPHHLANQPKLSQ